MTTLAGVAAFALLFALFGTFVVPRRGCRGGDCHTCEESCDLESE